MTLTAETTSALAAALAKVGLGLGSPNPGLAGSLPGPLVNLIGVDGGSPMVVAAVADRSDIQTDSVIQSIGGAISRVRPELALHPMDPVADLNDLVGSVGAPADILPVTGNGQIIGAIVWAQERRSGGPDQAAELAAEPAAEAIRAAGSAAGAAAGGTISSMSANASQLTRLRDVQLSVAVELGRTSMSVSEVLSLEIGSVIELDRAAGAPIDVRVNGTLLARGEVVVVDDEYAIRVTEMIDPDRG